MMLSVKILTMKKIFAILTVIMALVSCKSGNEIPYTELNHYFVRNGIQCIPENPKIETEDEFFSLFGMASVMGKDGVPTPVDFEKEFVIAVINPVTDINTELSASSLKLEGDEIVFDYEECVGEKQSWSMQPSLLIKLSKDYQNYTVTLNKQITANPNVAICAYDAHKGEWIRINATLVEDHRTEVKKAMLDANPELRDIYDENDGNTAVYYMKDAKLPSAPLFMPQLKWTSRIGLITDSRHLSGFLSGPRMPIKKVGLFHYICGHESISSGRNGRHRQRPGRAAAQ